MILQKLKANALVRQTKNEEGVDTHGRESVDIYFFCKLVVIDHHS